VCACVCVFGCACSLCVCGLVLGLCFVLLELCWLCVVSQVTSSARAGSITGSCGVEWFLFP